MAGPKAAAFAAWVLLALQDAPVDAANFYTAEIQVFGMFSFHGVPRKNFHAFRAFRTLLDTPRRVQTPPCEAGRLAISAGLNADGNRAAILLSNFDTAGGVPDLIIRRLPWSGPTAFEVHLVDAQHDFQLARRGTLETEDRLASPELRAPAVMLVKLAPLLAQAR